MGVVVAWGALVAPAVSATGCGATSPRRCSTSRTGTSSRRAPTSRATASPSPLEHMWSLAVEEQFYLVWPLLLGLIALLVRQPRRRVVAVGVIAGVGLVASAVRLEPAVGEQRAGSRLSRHRQPDLRAARRCAARGADDLGRASGRFVRGALGPARCWRGRAGCGPGDARRPGRRDPCVRQRRRGRRRARHGGRDRGDRDAGTAARRARSRCLRSPTWGGCRTRCISGTGRSRSGPGATAGGI